MLIDELKQGSPEAFAALVERYGQKVVGTCYGFLNNREDAEDAAQEVFIEVYRSIRQFQGQAELDTWVYRIAVNKSLDALRKMKRRKRLADLKALFLAQKRPERGPAERLEQQERQAVLQEQIALLPENQGVALVLSQYDKLSNKQVAEVMETSESAVESLLHRARANLRKSLRKYFEKNL